jgi:hypothetical protein
MAAAISEPLNAAVCSAALVTTTFNVTLPMHIYCILMSLIYTLKIEPACLIETFVPSYKTPHYHNLQDRTQDYIHDLSVNLRIHGNYFHKQD